MTAESSDRQAMAVLDHPAGTGRPRRESQLRPRLVLPGEVLPGSAEAATPAAAPPPKRSSCRDVAIRMQLAMCGVFLPPDQAP